MSFDATPDSTTAGQVTPGAPAPLPTLVGPAAPPEPIKATATIAAPLTLRAEGVGFVPRMVAATRIRRPQAIALRLLQEGLGAKSQAEAIRWLLDELVEQLPPEALES